MTLTTENHIILVTVLAIMPPEAEISTNGAMMSRHRCVVAAPVLVPLITGEMKMGRRPSTLLVVLERDMEPVVSCSSRVLRVHGQGLWR